MRATLTWLYHFTRLAWMVSLNSSPKKTDGVDAYREFVNSLVRLDERAFASELRAWRVGSEEARRALGEGFLPDAMAIANEVYKRNPNLQQLELIQEANAALSAVIADFPGESRNDFRKQLRIAILVRLAAYEKELGAPSTTNQDC